LITQGVFVSGQILLDLFLGFYWLISEKARRKPAESPTKSEENVAAILQLGVKRERRNQEKRRIEKNRVE